MYEPNVGQPCYHNNSALSQWRYPHLLIILHFSELDISNVDGLGDFWGKCQYFHQIIPHGYEILCHHPICMCQADWSYCHQHTKTQYIFHNCLDQVSISILLHIVKWGYGFDVLACFCGLFLCTLHITWRMSFEDPHLMTSNYCLEYPTENKKNERQYFFSQNKHSIFYQNYCSWSEWNYNALWW